MREIVITSETVLPEVHLELYSETGYGELVVIDHDGIGQVTMSAEVVRVVARALAAVQKVERREARRG